MSFLDSAGLAHAWENIKARLPTDIDYNDLMAMSDEEAAGRHFSTYNAADATGIEVEPDALTLLLNGKLDKAVSARHAVTVAGEAETLAYSSDGFFIRLSIPNLNQQLSATPWRFLQGRDIQSIVTLYANTDPGLWSIGSDGQLIFPDFGARYVDYTIDPRLTGSGVVAGNNSAELVFDMLRQNAQTVAVSRGAVITNATPSFSSKTLALESYTLNSNDPYIDGGVVPRLSCDVASTVTQVDIIIKGTLN